MLLFQPETNNFNNSAIVGRRKLRPKCIVTITPKAESLKFKANV